MKIIQIMSHNGEIIGLDSEGAMHEYRETEYGYYWFLIPAEFAE